MRIGLLAPVALPVPPCGYGGTELVIHQLAEGLVAHGHHVTLFAAGDSSTSAELRSLYPRALTSLAFDRPERYRRREQEHVAWAFSQAGEFDLIHDHTKAFGVLMAPAVATPVVTTLHNDFTPERRAVYLRHPRHPYVAISAAQARRCPELDYAGVVYNGIDLEAATFKEHKGAYLLFLGRLCAAKGTHTAIAIAKVLGLPLVLAGKIDPVDRDYVAAEVMPHLDGDHIRYVGEVTGRAKWELVAGARCLLFPIQWAEPFGLVMIEAMACGTPVVATRWGSVSEVVSHGVSGWIADDFAGLLEGVHRSRQLAPHACRRWVERQFSAQAMVEGYLAIYARLLRDRSLRRSPSPTVR